MHPWSVEKLRNSLCFFRNSKSCQVLYQFWKIRLRSQSNSHHIPNQKKVFNKKKVLLEILSFVSGRQCLPIKLFRSQRRRRKNSFWINWLREEKKSKKCILQQKNINFSPILTVPSKVFVLFAYLSGFSPRSLRFCLILLQREDKKKMHFKSTLNACEMFSTNKMGGVSFMRSRWMNTVTGKLADSWRKRKNC